MKNQKGFTLIELLLVLAIIGIIAAIAIPALLGQREKAKIKAVQAMVANVAGELARVNDDIRSITGSVPTTAAVISGTMALSNFQYPAAKNPYGGIVTPYLGAAPTNPGEIGMVGNDAFVDPATGATGLHAVTITGLYMSAGSVVSTVKVVALD